MNTTRKLAACVATVGLLAAIAAGSASAATFSPTGTLKGTGNLTWTLQGGPTISNCPTVPLTGSNWNGSAWIVGLLNNATFCNGNMVRFLAWFVPGTGQVAVAPTTYLETPFGSTSGPSFVGDWVQGNATTPSRIVFNNDQVGYTAFTSPSKAVWVSGSIEVTTPTGGLVTLQ